MPRRLPHIACSLWLALTSLVPGPGWTLCVSPSGHVAMEVVAPVLPGTDASACREDCSEDRCEACHDVRLASAERACSRRDVVAAELDAAPAGVDVRHVLERAIARPHSPTSLLPDAERTHLTSVLRI